VSVFFVFLQQTEDRKIAFFFYCSATVLYQIDEERAGREVSIQTERVIQYERGHMSLKEEKQGGWHRGEAKLGNGRSGIPWF
jgi:hypothetical protein